MYTPQTREWLCDKCGTQIIKNTPEKNYKGFYKFTLEGLHQGAAVVDVTHDMCELCALEFTREYLKWIKKS